jgi:hypothetical protein
MFLRWIPVGRDGFLGAVLRDTTGRIYGSIRPFMTASTLWIGTAVFDPSPNGSNGVCQVTSSKEKAMEYVIKTLQEKGKL